MGFIATIAKLEPITTLKMHQSNLIALETLFPLHAIVDALFQNRNGMIHRAGLDARIVNTSESLTYCLTCRAMGRDLLVMT